MTANNPLLQLRNSALFRQKAMIGGEWVDADDRRSSTIIDPATGIMLGVVPDMGAGETRRAIAAADAALPAWRSKTAKDRAKILRAWFDLIIANQQDLARILTAEQGKPLALASSNGSPKKAAASMAT